MKQSKRRFFSGNSLGQAVIAAACEFDLTPAEVAYKQIEKRHGFLRSRKRFLIEVDPSSPRREEVQDSEPKPSAKPSLPEGAPIPAGQRDGVVGTAGSPGPGRGTPAGDSSERRPAERRPSAPSPKEASSQRAPEESEQVGEQDATLHEGSVAEQAAQRLIEVLGLDLTSEVVETAEGTEVLLKGPDAELLTEEHGKGLFAFEHLMPKVVRGLSGERLLCHVDAAGFRARRQAELEALALDAAAEVRESGEPKTLDLLNPAERRIVHMTLAEDSGVETESEGGGYLKRLTIWPL